MNNFPINKKESGRNQSLVSTVLKDGSIVETLYQRDSSKTVFVIWKDGNWKIESELKVNEAEKFIPYSATNNLLVNEVVLFPSLPEEYETEQTLLLEIRRYLHHYVDLSPLFEKIASYYVMLSWVYDGFNELPYLRVKGEPGSGKTRFLQVVGSIAYKPIFASGASSISPLFRILEAVRGTLIIDESDFRISDEKAQMVKILNNGNVKGFPVLRSEVSPLTKEFNPRAYHVFGPKIIASRGNFQDRALESRFISEEMGQSRLREDIPINLPDRYKEEALHIRNKLLLFRFRNLHKRMPSQDLVDRSIEARLNQVFVPLLSIIEDENTRKEIQELARSYNQQNIAERGLDMEAQLLEVIRDLSQMTDVKLSMKEITEAFTKKHGEEYDRKITPKFIGYLLRVKLGLKTRKTQGVYVIPLSEQPKLERHYERYGINLQSDSPKIL